MNLLRSKSVRAVGAVIALGAITLAGTQPASAAPSTPSTTSDAALAAALRAGTLAAGHGTYALCKANNLPCDVQIVTVAPGSNEPLSSKTPLGYGATELEQVYGLSGASSANGTVAVLSFGGYPTIDSDLATYRSTYGLPPCTKANGCLKQINYLGGKPYKPARKGFRKFIEEDISVETSIDVQMVSAACPGCKIVNIELPLSDYLLSSKKQFRTSLLHFATSAKTAHDLGYSALSISYGASELPYTYSDQIRQLMTEPGMAITTSSGDASANFLPAFNTFPQNQPTVTVVGGTSLYKDVESPSGYLEVGWEGAGSGCSSHLPPAEGQPASVYSLCKGGSGRAYSDVSAVADPYTGVAVYNGYYEDFFTGKPLGWIVIGGTSVAAPFVGGMYGRAPRDPSLLGPNTLYADPASDFNDIVVGTNFGYGQCPKYGLGEAICVAGPGWDGLTGLGTPKGLAPFGG